MLFTFHVCLKSSLSVEQRRLTGIYSCSVLKAKTNTDDQDIEDMSPPVSTPESESQVSSPMLSESKDLYTHEIPQSIVASETVSSFLFLTQNLLQLLSFFRPMLAFTCMP